MITSSPRIKTVQKNLSKEILYKNAFFNKKILSNKKKRYREQKDLHMVFIDLEKAYDKVPRNVMWWALEKHKVPTKYITLIKDMYKDATTFVRTCDATPLTFLLT